VCRGLVVLAHEQAGIYLTGGVSVRKHPEKILFEVFAALSCDADVSSEGVIAKWIEYALRADMHDVFADGKMVFAECVGLGNVAHVVMRVEFGFGCGLGVGWYGNQAGGDADRYERVKAGKKVLDAIVVIWSLILHRDVFEISILVNRIPFIALSL
jgi:hypothetical protein